MEKLNITANNKIKDVYRIRANPTLPKISPINLFNACPIKFNELSKDKYTKKVEAQMALKDIYKMTL